MATVDYEPLCKPEELDRVEELRTSAFKQLGWEQVEEASAEPLFMRECLLRYMRARPTIAAATKMLLASVQWRREFDLEQRLREWLRHEA